MFLNWKFKKNKKVAASAHPYSLFFMSHHPLGQKYDLLKFPQRADIPQDTAAFIWCLCLHTEEYA